MRHSTLLSSLVLVLLGFALQPSAGPQVIPQSKPREAPQKKAWDILEAGAHDSNMDKRVHAIHALGLITGDSAAAQLAEAALQDKQPDVRAAAAKALGAMRSTKSIPKLEKASSDKHVAVALAAAGSLLLLKNSTGYDVYYDVLTRERKGGESLMAEQMKQLKTPGKAMEFAFEQGIGFLPFGGYGMEVLNALTTGRAGPTRATAARVLAQDPNPRSGQALAKAVTDEDWIVRAAALEGIARRADPALLKGIEPAMSDKKDIVRYTAAAAVLHLARIQQGNGDKEN